MTHNVVPETVVNQPGIPDVEPAPAFAGVDIILAVAACIGTASVIAVNIPSRSRTGRRR